MTKCVILKYLLFVSFDRDTSHCYNVNPSEAVKIHQDVKSKRTLAVHWGTFQVSNEVRINSKFYALK